MTASATPSPMRSVRSIATRVHRSVAGSVSVFLRDAGQGMLEISHNMLALVGLVVLAVAVFAMSRDDLRFIAEEHALGWLKAREVARTPPPPMAEDTLADLAELTAVERATAADPRLLNRQQAAVAQWISRRYRVAPEPISRLVQEAWSVGARVKLDPTLILAIMAVESSFNPFAQSNVGAQGLMQVLTRVHDDKYEAFGGNHAAFDPVTNLRVGVQVLKECIARAGSIDAGLRFYVGAANMIDDNGYAGKVLAEQGQLKLVANGKAVPTNVSNTTLQAAAPAAIVTTGAGNGAASFGATSGGSSGSKPAEVAAPAPVAPAPPASDEEPAHLPDRVAMLTRSSSRH
ncbi:MAG: lytic transglycosylase [Rhizobacter sp.]|nr:lytic transglycosylase [Rhizobacter sp.]